MNMNALSSSGFFKEYADANSAIDCVADSALTNEAGSPCERIQARGAGTLVVTPDRGPDVTLTFAANETKWVRVRAIKSGTATGLTVFWR